MLLSIVSIRNKTVRNMSINIIYNCSYKFHYGNILWLQKILCIKWFLKNILDVICLFPFSLSLVSSYTRDVYMLDKPLPNTLVHHNLNPSNLAWLDLNLRIRKEKLRLDWIVIVRGQIGTRLVINWLACGMWAAPPAWPEELWNETCH